MAASCACASPCPTSPAAPPTPPRGSRKPAATSSRSSTSGSSAPPRYARRRSNSSWKPATGITPMRWCGPFRKRASRFLLLDSLLHLFVRHTQAGFFGLIEAAAQADLLVACDAVGADRRLRRILRADRGTNARALGIAIGARLVGPVRDRVRGVAAHDLRIGSALVSGYACHRGLLFRDQNGTSNHRSRRAHACASASSTRTRSGSPLGPARKPKLAARRSMARL